MHRCKIYTHRLKPVSENRGHLLFLWFVWIQDIVSPPTQRQDMWIIDTFLIVCLLPSFLNQHKVQFLLAPKIFSWPRWIVEQNLIYLFPQIKTHLEVLLRPADMIRPYDSINMTRTYRLVEQHLISEVFKHNKLPFKSTTIKTILNCMLLLFRTPRRCQQNQPFIAHVKRTFLFEIMQQLNNRTCCFRCDWSQISMRKKTNAH